MQQPTYFTQFFKFFPLSGLEKWPIFSVVLLVVLPILSSIGCGTTKWSDTGRTATEQLLLTNAMDKSIEKIDFQPLSGKKVAIVSKLDEVTDSKYLVSGIHQQLLACGAIVCKEEEADYILEIRAGAVGTDRNDLFYGIPGFSIPTGLLGDSAAGTTAIPEMAFIKKTDQRAVVKIAMFAYNKKANTAFWQSGTIPAESRVKAWWIFGSGPWVSGDICNGTELAGTKVPEWNLPVIVDAENLQGGVPDLTVTKSAFFVEHPKLVEAEKNNEEKETPEEKTPPAPTLQPVPEPTPTPQLAPEPAPLPPLPVFPHFSTNTSVFPRSTFGNNVSTTQYFTPSSLSSFQQVQPAGCTLTPSGNLLENSESTGEPAP